jgi:predicted  nucleic acid-binding Zn-ribbon protein
MARAKDKPAKTALDTLQEWLSGGGQALLEGVQTVQQLVLATGRGVEGQFGTLLTALEESLRDQVDRLVTGISVSLRSEVENVHEELQELREQFRDPSATVPIDQLLEPLRALANGALERAAYAQTRLTELAQRLERFEQREDPSVRLADLERRLSATREGPSIEQFAQLEQRLRDMRVELGEKAADLPSMRERLAKIEVRVLETSKEQIARAGEATSLRDRLARLEARLTDLSREQVARAVEAAGLRERVFRLEQRAGTYAQAGPEATTENDHPTG